MAEFHQFATIMILTDVELFKISLYKHICAPTPINPLLFAAAGALAAPVAVTGFVWILGFGAAGIVQGSAAAWIMSLYGGSVTIGSVCAVLQSIGAAGLGTTGIILSGTGGAAVGATAEKLLEFYEKNKLSESQEKSLKEFLKIIQSDDNKVTFIFNKPILQEEYIDKFLQGLDVAKFTTSKIFILKDNSFNNRFILSNYILVKLRETYGNSRVRYVPEGIKLDLSTFEF